jgi:S-methylmethionine-dependent homocysteine/selenocysteine methylase
VIAFTVETDGRLPCGMALGDAIERVDAETDGAPAYFMVNCAHPTHFADVLDGDWVARIGGLRVNASRMSHAEWTRRRSSTREIPRSSPSGTASCTRSCRT